MIIFVSLLTLAAGVNHIYAAITAQTAPSLPTSLSWSGGAEPINRGVTAGHVLTADMWNALVNQVATLGGGGGGGSQRTYSREGTTCYAGDTAIGWKRIARTCAGGSPSICGTFSGCTMSYDSTWLTSVPTSFFSCWYVYRELNGDHCISADRMCTSYTVVLCQAN